MSASFRPTLQGSAIQRARRSWKGVAELVSNDAMRNNKTRSPWLADHASRPTRGVKAADQTFRMASTMRDEGWSKERATISLTAFVADVVEMAYADDAQCDGAA